MVYQTAGNDSFIRSISCRERSPLPAGAGRDRGRIEHQHHHTMIRDNTMIRAYRLYTGADGNSHVVRGSVSGDALVEAESILFKETPAHASLTGTRLLSLNTSLRWLASSNLPPEAEKRSRFVRVMS